MHECSSFGFCNGRLFKRVLHGPKRAGGSRYPRGGGGVGANLARKFTISDALGDSIEFEAEHYEEAFKLVKFWRDKQAYVGGMIMEYLKAEMEKI